jgi:pyruvate formate lyase activating enzyme
MKEALYYEAAEHITCLLCPHQCVIPRDKTGLCLVRRHHEGKLVAENYGKVTSASFDPIEKKPLYHYYPSRPVFSIGTMGCNMKCSFCQNHTISQETGRYFDHLSPEETGELAVSKNSVGCAFTYSEPMVWYEYLLDAAPLVRAKGGKNILVTNGFINGKPLERLLPYIDAMNIDLKSFKDTTYKRMLGGGLEPVKKAIEAALKNGVHVEITTLLVTGMNDVMTELEDMADYLASLNPLIPWHLSRYFPSYHYDRPATSSSFMKEVLTMAREKLHYTYGGNISLEGGGDSTCHACGHQLVKRDGYSTVILGLSPHGRCSNCGEEVPFVIEGSDP